MGTRSRCKLMLRSHGTGRIFDQLNIRAFRISVNRTVQNCDRQNRGQSFAGTAVLVILNLPQGSYSLTSMQLPVFFWNRSIVKFLWFCGFYFR